MKKSFITALILLITISLMGLISIQIYWIRNSIALRDAQFRRNVRMALTEVNHVLEKREKMHRLRMHDFSKLIFHYDSIRGDAGGNNMLLLSSQSKRDSSFFLESDGAFSLKLEQHVTTAALAPEINGEDAAKVSDESQPTQRDRFELDDFQASEIAKLIFDISTIDYGSNFLERFHSNDLDSLIRVSLQEAGGIHTPFHFGVFNKLNEPQIIAEEELIFTKEILSEGYRMRLLPTDFVIPPTYLNVWFPEQDSYLLRSMWPLLTSSTLFVIVIILAFGYTIRTILWQKKLSEMKNDFINNMTHELKTPISTISLACEALADKSLLLSPDRTTQYIGMIKDENKRLGTLVENVLQSAVLDRKEMEMDHEQINLHEVIELAIQNVAIQASQKDGVITSELMAETFILKGDRIHLTNLVYNLLDNAIKYCPEYPKINIATYTQGDTILMEVSDNGIGIKKDDQKRIFDKLYRVSTGDVHDIKGFGLGLSYVRTVVEKHHGGVSVRSELGKGSTFIINLPIENDI